MFLWLPIVSGGWLLIGRFIMETLDSINDISVSSDSYRTILPAYTSKSQYLLRNGFSQLKEDMGFTQIRLYCFKKTRGRVFHIMTNEDVKGAKVLKFFTSSNNMPKAYGSFSILPDDNSSLVVNCGKWGYPNSDRWGHGNMLTNSRLFIRAMTWVSVPRFYRLKGPKYHCDDNDNLNPSIGDTWQVFVQWFINSYWIWLSMWYEELCRSKKVSYRRRRLTPSFKTA